MKGSDDVILATDYDREGEAIAYHVADPAGGRPRPRQARDVHRDHPRRDPRGLPGTRARSTCSCSTRRRPAASWTAWSGYRISPILWKRVRPGLSAGRVQSVAVRLIVEREREIRAFNPVEYWSVDVRLTPRGRRAARSLARLDRDPRGQARHLARQEGRAARRRGRRRHARRAPPPSRATASRTSSARNASARPRRRSPPPPCSRRRRASSGSAPARRCRSPSASTKASTLPGEGSVGLITYMRTDSVTIADTALREIAELVKTEYGKEYSLAESAPVQDEVAQRAGGARGGPAHQRDAHACTHGERPRPRPAAPLHLDLAAHDGHADGRGPLQPGGRRRRGAADGDVTYGLRATGQTMIFDGFIRVY